MTLSASESKRLRSWVLDIVADRRGPHSRDEAHDRIWPGGLSIHRGLGLWWNYATGDGGDDAISLIRFLHLDENYTYTDAEVWAERWLATHPGTGSCDGGGSEEDDPGVAAAISKAKTEDILARAGALEGMESEIYWQSRRINPPYSLDTVQFLPEARIGEHAIVGIVRSFSHDRIVGVELRYITSTGDSKSHRERTFARFNLEKVADGVFELPRPAVLDNPSIDLAIFEGLPDLLSSEALYARNFRRIGLPGIGTLGA